MLQSSGEAVDEVLQILIKRREREECLDSEELERY